MTADFSIYRLETDAYINDEFVDRLVMKVCKKNNFSTFTMLFSPVDAPRRAIMNRCRDYAKKNDNMPTSRKTFWLPTFCCCNMLTIGEISRALLWHIYRSLPAEAHTDEKIMYNLGKISVMLPSVSDFLIKKANNCNLSPDLSASITGKALPADRKSPVSSIFSACEQIAELPEMFLGLGRRIGEIGGFDTLVVPVIDVDMCLPEQAISLLFTIRNFFCNETTAFIIGADCNILSCFLASVLNNSISVDQSRTMLYSIIDDWQYLPSPVLTKILQNIDRPLNMKERHYIISIVNRSGLLSRFSDPLHIYGCLRRYNGFISDMRDKCSLDEYALFFLLFLTGGCRPDLLSSLAALPDLKRFIKTFREKSKNSNFSERKRIKTSKASLRFPSITTDASDENYPPVYGNFDESSLQLLASFFFATPPTLTDANIAKWIVRIIPFI